MMAAGRGQLVGRLWAWRLGKWTPGQEAALRQAVRLDAIKVLYTRELQVRLRIGRVRIPKLVLLPCSSVLLLFGRN
jgi:hypothetical protein